MLRIGLSFVAVFLALLSLAVFAGTEARAGGAGHHHAHAPAIEVAAGGQGVVDPAASSVDRTGEALGLAVPTQPCGGGHSDEGGLCCGVACHAAMAVPGIEPGFVKPTAERRLAGHAERRDDRFVLFIERPPRG